MFRYVYWKITKILKKLFCCARPKHDSFVFEIAYMTPSVFTKGRRVLKKFN